MNREEIETALKEAGYKVDRWGHYQKALMVRVRGQETTVLRLFRVKLQAISIRVEVQFEGSSGNQWARVSGAYYKDVRKLANGQYRIGSHLIIKDG